MFTKLQTSAIPNETSFTLSRVLKYTISVNCIVDLTAFDL